MALFRHPEHFSIDYMNSLMVKKTPPQNSASLHRTNCDYLEYITV